MGIKYDKAVFSVCAVAEILGSHSTLRDDITSIVTDSREAESGALFVAIKGERFDGHDYISQAISKGAVAVVAERMPDGLEQAERVILCESSLDALGKIASAYKSRIHPKTVAVTGSVGKTTTKEFVYAVASANYSAHKTEGNF